MSVDCKDGKYFIPPAIMRENVRYARETAYHRRLDKTKANTLAEIEQIFEDVLEG